MTLETRGVQTGFSSCRGRRTLSLTRGGIREVSGNLFFRRPSKGAALLRMKLLRLIVPLLLAVSGAAFAQDEERRAPPIEIPDFSNLDEYIYEPKSVLVFGVRYIGGAKTSFSGTGRIPSQEDPGSATGANLLRVYHDGRVQPDARTVARLDSSGNPIIDPQSNTPAFDPIAPDGRTNTWNYTSLDQLSLPGFVRFNSYSAEVIDTTVRDRKPAASGGLDMAVSRDMGKLLGSRVAWQLTAGMSLNDLSSTRSDPVRARLTTVSDFYSLFGRTPPDGPYSSPSTATENVVDAVGNPVLGADGVSQTISVDTSVLLGNEPAGRVTTTATDDSSVSNRWKLKGAYYTFRAGPTLQLSLTNRFKATLGIGAAVVYSGSSYTVTQTLTPPAGAEITDTSSSEAYKLLPGYFADASLQFDLTERTGFYAGAVFQSAGSYTQAIDTDNAHYATKIDLANMSGFRAGMSYRF